MNLNSYRFDLVWEIGHPRHRIFDVLTRIEDYPHWWPDYREVRQIDEETMAIVLRSSLPYELRLTNRFVIRDRTRGHFRLALDGDIAGWIDFTMTDEGSDLTRIRIRQECTAEKRLLRLLAPIGRRAFAHNHGLTMRRGRVGLSDLLSEGHH